MTAKEALSYYADLSTFFDKTVDRKRFIYQIHENDDYEKAFKNNPSDLQKVYWQEILQRAHWAAFSALLRNLKWANGANNAIADHNLLSFTANLRCLIESSGDNLLSLQAVSATLAENNQNIMKCLDGILDGNILYVAKELEETLIHFAYARKITEEEKKLQGKLPKYQNAKPASEYLKRLDNKIDNGPINDLYSILCQFTHPAAHSIHYMFDITLDGNLYKFSYSSNADKKYIDLILTFYNEEIIKTLMLGFNPCLLTLKTLNLFNYASIKTPEVDNINLDELGAWKNVMQKFNLSQQ